MDLLNTPLEDLVFNILRSDAPVEKYSRKFFDVITAYSFEKTNLQLEEHFFPRVHVSNILDSFARNDPSVTQGISLFQDPEKRILAADDPEQLLSFCDTVVFFSGFLPEIFNRKIVSREYYEQLARSGFESLHKKTIGNSYLRQMSANLGRYIGALSFMRNNLLRDSFQKDEKAYIIN